MMKGGSMSMDPESKDSSEDEAGGAPRSSAPLSARMLSRRREARAERQCLRRERYRNLEKLQDIKAYLVAKKKKKSLIAGLDEATAEMACARIEFEKKGRDTPKEKSIERMQSAFARCSRLKARIARSNFVSLPKEEDSLDPIEENRISTPDDVRQRDAADEVRLTEEITAFLKVQPIYEQLRLIDFGLKPENSSDLPIIARAFLLCYADTEQLSQEFADEILIARLEAEINHLHVTSLQAPTDILRILLRVPANLRRALKLGTVATVSKRLQGILVISSTATEDQHLHLRQDNYSLDSDPLLAAKFAAIAALRALLLALLFRPAHCSTSVHHGRS